MRITVATVCTLTDLGIMAGSHPPHDSAVEGMLPHDLRAHLGGRNGDPLRCWYPSNGYRRPAFPAPMGHEAAGIVASLGGEANSPDALVFADEPLAPGDHVATFKVPGAYSEYSALASSNVVKIPAYMDDDEGSLLEPLIINFNCLKRCWRIQRPGTVAVLGQGCQGLLSTQIVKALGAERVIVSEPIAHRRELALELGADVAIDPLREHVVDGVMRHTRSHGADLVVECAGAEEALRAAPYLVRRGGMLGQIGAFTNAVTFDYGYVHFRHFIVVPADYFLSLREKSDQVREVLELVRERRIRLKPLVTHRFALDGVNAAFDLLRQGDQGVVKVAIDVAAPRRPARHRGATTRANPVGWGVLGGSRVAREHFLPALQQSRDARLVVLGCRSADRGRAIVEAAGEGRACTSYGDVLDDPSVDAVYISLPNALHHEWILASLAAGKHVLCEKALVLSMSQVDGVRDAARRTGRVVMEAFRYRFHPQYEPGTWDGILRKVGEPMTAHAHATLLLEDPGDIRNDAALGGGALWDIGCYCLSMLTWRFGSPDSVRGVQRTRGRVDWSGAVAMQWESGFDATASWSFARARSQRLTLIGTRGVLDLFTPFWERRLAAARLQTAVGVEELSLPVANCFRREIEHFAAVLRGEVPPAVTLDDTEAWLAVAEHLRGGHSVPAP